MIDYWEIQFGLIYDCMRACVYGDYIYRQKPSEKSAWVGIMDICYADAVISWNQLFGTRSQETHWSKFVAQIDIPKGDKLIPFSKELIIKKLNISEEEWGLFHKNMTDCRNVRIAHYNVKQELKRFPNTKLMIESCLLYREWLIQALHMGKRLGYQIKVTDQKNTEVIEEFIDLIKKAYHCL